MKLSWALGMHTVDLLHIGEIGIPKCSSCSPCASKQCVLQVSFQLSLRFSPSITAVRFADQLPIAAQVLPVYHSKVLCISASSCCPGSPRLSRQSPLQMSFQLPLRCPRSITAKSFANQLPAAAKVPPVYHSKVLCRLASSCCSGSLRASEQHSKLAMLLLSSCLHHPLGDQRCDRETLHGAHIACDVL